MALKLQIMPEGWRPTPHPQWYAEQLAREAAFNAKHPRCIGCGRFIPIRKHWNQCADCADYSY